MKRSVKPVLGGSANTKAAIAAISVWSKLPRARLCIVQTKAFRSFSQPTISSQNVRKDWSTWNKGVLNLMSVGRVAQLSDVTRALLLGPLHTSQQSYWIRWQSVGKLQTRNLVQAYTGLLSKAPIWWYSNIHIIYIHIYIFLMYRHVQMCFDSSSRNCRESMHARSQRALRFTSFAILLQFAQQVGRYW